MIQQTLTIPNGSFTRCARVQTRRLSRRVITQVRAEDSSDPKLDFTSNKRAGLGFTDNDSAGQTNIFAVEPKSYVQGTKADGTSDAQTSTQGGAAIGGTVAVGVVVAALILLQGDEELVTVSGPDASLKPLSEYASQFTREIVPPPAAPAVVDTDPVAM